MRYRLLLSLRVLLIAALACVLLASCGSDDEASGSGDSSDAAAESSSGSAADEPLGDDAPRKIVSLSPTATEMLFAIDAGDQVVAVDEFSNYPLEAPMTDLSGWQPNVEAIAAYEPDLVVSESPIEGLEALSITNLVQEAPANIDGVYDQINELGTVTGHPNAAAAVVADMKGSIEQSVADAQGSEAKTYYHELGTELYTATSATFVGEVYALFGLENIADSADADGAAGGYPQLSEEVILDANPDLIFLADTISMEQSADTVAERPGWDQLSAVQDGHIIELNDDVASRWGPRLPEFVYAVSNALQKAK